MTSMAAIVGPALRPAALARAATQLGWSCLRMIRVLHEVWIETMQLKETARQQYPYLEWGH